MESSIAETLFSAKRENTKASLPLPWREEWGTDGGQRIFNRSCSGRASLFFEVFSGSLSPKSSFCFSYIILCIHGSTWVFCLLIAPCFCPCHVSYNAASPHLSSPQDYKKAGVISFISAAPELSQYLVYIDSQFLIGNSKFKKV